METLNYDVLAKSGYNGYILKNAPEKVLQFGEGNFLRAFVDYWFDLANEKADWNGKCVLVQPIAPGLAKMINEQEGLYTLYLRGSENGKKVDDKRVISSVSRCLNPYEEEGFRQMMEVAASDDLEIIVSNTTEAGIVYDPACKLEDVPASSFPGKLTQVLYHRYKAGKKGILMLACELIDNNGKELLKCVNQYIEQWGLEDGFKKYVNEDCTFCGSLVDRIVPGRIRDPKEVAELEQKHGYADPLLDVGEVFGVWVIEGDTKLNDVLPFRKAGIEDHVFVTPDMSPYKKRKVRILNGAHTGFVLGAYLSKGGKSFICCSSTFKKKDGTLESRIRPTLENGSVVTDARPCAHWFVTEYGKVNLKGLTAWQRAEALISVAHPDFREQLIQEAEKMRIWKRSNKR